MKPSYFAITAMFVIAVSCDTDHVNKSSEQPDIMAFADVKAYYETYVSLAKMSSPEALEAWAQSNNHSTLLHTKDADLRVYSDALKAILNKDAEFQLGEDIIWFNKGNLYAFSKGQIPNRSKLKETPDKLVKFGHIAVTPVDADDEAETGRTAAVSNKIVNFNSFNAQNQKEFWEEYYAPCGSGQGVQAGWRKYVHELVDETMEIAPGPVRYSTLYLRVKLEWKGKKWQDAGEQRYTSVSVSGSVSIFNSGLGSASFNVNTSRDCYTGHWYVYIINATHGPMYNGPGAHWIVNMDGTIYHNIKGDNPSNAWSNTYCEICDPGTSVLW